MVGSIFLWCRRRLTQSADRTGAVELSIDAERLGVMLLRLGGFGESGAQRPGIRYCCNFRGNGRGAAVRADRFAFCRRAWASTACWRASS